MKALAIEYPQDVNSRSFIGEETPLYLTSRVGHRDVAWLLIKHGADTAARSKDGTTPLHHASEGGHVDLVKLLIEHGADPTAQSENGMTPLHRASEGGHVDLARFLIKHGAHANIRDESDRTPLHLALQSGHQGVARLLLDHCKANSLPMTSEQDQGLQCPVPQESHRATAQDNGRSITQRGTSECDDAVLAQLRVAHSAIIATKDKDRWTPLHGAPEGGHVDLIPFQEEDDHGADTTVKDRDKSTPLNPHGVRR